MGGHLHMETDVKSIPHTQDAGRDCRNRPECV
jgi:hypothetical protein